MSNDCYSIPILFAVSLAAPALPSYRGFPHTLLTILLSALQGLPSLTFPQPFAPLRCLVEPISPPPVPSTWKLPDLHFSPPKIFTWISHCPLKLNVSIMKHFPKHYPLLPALSRTFLKLPVNKLSEPSLVKWAWMWKAFCKKKKKY